MLFSVFVFFIIFLSRILKIVIRVIGKILCLLINVYEVYFESIEMIG